MAPLSRNAVLAALVAFVALELQTSFLLRLVTKEEWPYSSNLHLLNYFGMVLMPQPVRVLEHVLENAKRGDPADVVAKVDEFCWQWPTMNVGDVKGKIVDDTLEGMGSSAKVVVELGSYMGYSTVRLASVLRRTSPEAVLYSVDPNPLGRAIQTALLDHAGLAGPGVSLQHKYSQDAIQAMAAEGKKIDFLFLDHMKHLYQSDAELAIKLGVLRNGSLIVADNVLNPGAPEYREWILAHPQFETKVHLTTLEYTKGVADEVLVSRFLG